MQPPATANAVAVPPGHEHVMTLRAVGTVNYECRPMTGMSGAYTWTLAAYDAPLRHWTGFRVGRLYQGPTWAYRDGSKLVGEMIGSVSGGPGRLPEQLWRTRSTGAKGALSTVVFVRRTGAIGDPPPATRCTGPRVGAVAKAEFEADYEFYAPK